MSHRILILLLVLLCQACSSAFFVRTIYQQLDDNFAEYLNEYADFDAKQQTIIKDASRSFADWHRETQLPEYRQFLVNTKARLAGPIDDQQVTEIADEMEQFGTQLSHQLWPPLEPLLTELSDAQIDQIATKLDQDLSEREQEYQQEQAKRDPDQPYQQELKQIRKLFKRVFDVKLNQPQVAEFERMLGGVHALEEASIELERQWNQQFIRLLDSPHQARDIDAIRRHLHLGGRLLRENRPQQVAHNKQVALTSFRRVMNSLDTDQRDNLQARLDDFVGIIDIL